VLHVSCLNHYKILNFNHSRQQNISNNVDQSFFYLEFLGTLVWCCKFESSHEGDVSAAAVWTRTKNLSGVDTPTVLLHLRERNSFRP
jgi:hypothetical protein